MSSFTITGPNGQTFTVAGPPGFSRDQAEAIVRQQGDTGALAGLDIGKAISSATQAAQGLLSALPMVGQTLANGGLPGNINLNTITSSLGTAAGAVSSQVQSALTGTGPALGTQVVGSDANAALAAVRNTVSAAGAAGIPGVDSVLATGSALTGVFRQVGGLAATAVNTLRNTFAGAPSGDAIDVGDMVVQGPVGSVPGLPPGVTQAAMAQVTKIVGQTAQEFSNTAGVGKFGLDMSQLESAGFLKPGVADRFGSDSMSNILQSSTVWTGKDGVNGLSNILSNPGLQNSIQGGLMAAGLAALKIGGVPVADLNPQALAGLANNAARSIPDTLNILRGVPGVPADVTAAFTTLSRDSAFAAKLAETKAGGAVLGQTEPVAAENTVNTETIDAASQRVVGNNRVPNVSDVEPSRILSESELKAQLESIKARSRELSSTYTTIAKNIQRESDSTLRSTGPQYLEQLETVRSNFEKIITELELLQFNANISARNQRGLFSLGTGSKIVGQLAKQQIEFVQDIDIKFVNEFIAIIKRSLDRLMTA